MQTPPVQNCLQWISRQILSLCCISVWLHQWPESDQSSYEIFSDENTDVTTYLRSRHNTTHIFFANMQFLSNQDARTNVRLRHMMVPNFTSQSHRSEFGEHAGHKAGVIGAASKPLRRRVAAVHETMWRCTTTLKTTNKHSAEYTGYAFHKRCDDTMFTNAHHLFDRMNEPRTNLEVWDSMILWCWNVLQALSDLRGSPAPRVIIVCVITHQIVECRALTTTANCHNTR